MAVLARMYHTWTENLVLQYSRYIVAIVLAGLTDVAAQRHALHSLSYRDKRLDILRKRFSSIANKLIMLCPSNMEGDIITGSIQASYFYTDVEERDDADKHLQHIL